MTGTSIHSSSVGEAQDHYVHFRVRYHWLRKELNINQAKQWKTGGTTKARLEDDMVPLAWLTAEAEHWMVYWRSVLHAQGVQAI
jgi:hypothetical protein